MKKIKSVVLILVLTSLLVLASIPASAAAGTINESANNNTFSTADLTYDDYDNYGTLSSTSDEDWWKITFTETGYANFWLGNIPSGCDWSFNVYPGSDLGIFYSAFINATDQRYIRIYVTPGTYRICIRSDHYSPTSASPYKFRVKFYSDFTTYATYTIDNDDDQGFSNAKLGFDTWFQSSTSFRGDARKQSCTSQANEYDWKFKAYSRNTTIFTKVSAYLYDVSFTDPQASYYVNDTYSYILSPAGIINQNLAACGWNNIGVTNTIIGTPEYDLVNVWFLRLIPSKSGSSYYCGADGVKLVIGY